MKKNYPRVVYVEEGKGSFSVRLPRYKVNKLIKLITKVKS